MPDDFHPGLLPTADLPQDVEAASTNDATRSASTFHRESQPNVHDPRAPKIPGYAITGEIARGGMGMVYAAKDLTLKREVAIKTLLPDADAARFVTESEITARLPHPGIPPVYALGWLDEGTPFLAMKLIRGRTLAELLKERPTPATELPRFIAIFEQIAQAVGFAHEQGIIHRDLKPLNVMVGAFGEVQVMDWGLAKDLASRECERPESYSSTDDLALTSAGAVMGTPGYMAPEQARGEPADARADVFALGAILAAILTGKPAFVGATARETIEKAARGDLSETLERLDASAADLDLVALAKECLAADLLHRPGDAKMVAQRVADYRLSVEERLKQAETSRAETFVREAEQAKRRRVLQAAAGVVAAVLIMGIIGTSVGMVRANGAAEAERRANETTNKRLAQIEKGVELLAGMLSGIDPRSEEQGGDSLLVHLRQRAEQSADQLDGEAVGDPLAVARLQTILGIALRELGNASKAVFVLEKAHGTRQRELGVNHPDTLYSRNSMAVAYWDAGQLDKALPLFETTLTARESKLGADHLETLHSRHNLAGAYRDAGQLDKALPLFEATLKAREAKLGVDHSDTLTSRNSFALAYASAGRFDKALPLLEATLKAREAKQGADHPLTLTSRNNLAMAYRAAGQLDKALPMFQATLKAREAKLGADHPGVMGSRNNLAAAYYSAGQFDKALPLLETTLKAVESKQGPEHPDTLRSRNNLAAAYQASKQFDKALPLLEATLKAREAKQGADHPDTLQSRNNLALAYQAVGQLDKALPLFEQAAAGVEKRRFQHEHGSRIIGDSIVAYEQRGQLDKAENWRRKWRAHVRDKAGAMSAEFAVESAALGFNLLQQRKWTDAEPLLRESADIREKTNPNAWQTFNTQSLLGAALHGQKKYAEAEPLLLKGYEGMKAREKSIPPQAATRIPEAIDRLVELYTATNKPDEVKKWKAERAKYPVEALPAAAKK